MSRLDTKQFAADFLDNDLDTFLAKVISNEDISDILITAFEGGVNYWCKSASGPIDKNFLDDNGVIKLETRDPSDPKPKPLTARALRRAIVVEAVRRFLEEQDAVTADVAVQKAVFNELVFG